MLSNVGTHFPNNCEGGEEKHFCVYLETATYTVLLCLHLGIQPDVEICLKKYFSHIFSILQIIQFEIS